MTTTQTPGQIFQALPAGKFATLAKISPRGALQLRKLKNGTGMFYWRSEHNGKRRSANKLRSYMRAAFQCAKSAKTNPSIPLSFKSFAISINPVSDTTPDPLGNQADKNPIKFFELQRYWRHLKSQNDYRNALLRFHLATGGQRIAQLLRLTNADIHSDHIVLHDPKGRTGQRARTHVVPLTNVARKR
ncbi:hypothetical protein [Comamonas aquatica]|uniref:hypothetical protein n=1 Tax=Comamonas aquatica TaxID=225991 RepID=UPI0024492615|nr:hypothetical protein [Comamonas aquatica]MDH1445101.1 hypothetical protein [Comamonas aquatica]